MSVSNQWISYVKTYASENNLSYSEAMKLAGPSYRSKKSKRSQRGGSGDEAVALLSRSGRQIAQGIQHSELIAEDIEDLAHEISGDFELDMITKGDLKKIESNVKAIIPNQSAIKNAEKDISKLSRNSDNKPKTGLEWSEDFVEYVQSYSAYNALKCLQATSFVAGPCTSYLRKDHPEEWMEAAKTVWPPKVDSEEINWKNLKVESGIAENLKTIGLQYHGCMTIRTDKHAMATIFSEKGLITVSLAYDIPEHKVFVIFGTTHSSAQEWFAQSFVTGFESLELVDKNVDDCLQYKGTDQCTNPNIGGANNCEVRSIMMGFGNKCSKKKEFIRKTTDDNGINSKNCKISKTMMNLYNIFRDRLLASIYDLKNKVDGNSIDRPPAQVVFGGHGFGSVFATLSSFDYSVMMERIALGGEIIIDNDRISWKNNNGPVHLDIEFQRDPEDGTITKVSQRTDNGGSTVPLTQQNFDIQVYTSASYGFGNQEFAKLVDNYVRYTYNMINNLDTVISYVGILNGIFRPGICLRFSHDGNLTLRQLLNSMKKTSIDSGKPSRIPGIVDWLNTKGYTDQLGKIGGALQSPTTVATVVSIVGAAVPAAHTALVILKYMWIIHNALKAHSQATYLVGMSQARFNMEMFDIHFKP
jgi:hypothetical protein